MIHCELRSELLRYTCTEHPTMRRTNTSGIAIHLRSDHRLNQDEIHATIALAAYHGGLRAGVEAANADAEETKYWQDTFDTERGR